MTANLTAGTLTPVITQLERRVTASNFRLPVGYSLDYCGEAAKRNEAARNLMADVAVLVTLSVATLIISFRSFRVSMIIAAEGLAIGLGCLALWCSFSIGLMVILGMTSRARVAKHTAIFLMTGIHENPRAQVGDALVPSLNSIVIDDQRHPWEAGQPSTSTLMNTCPA